MHKPTDNNSNTINTTPTVSLPKNTPVCQNYGACIFLLSEGIGSLEHSFDTQLQNLTQMQGHRTAFACGTANELRKDKRSKSNFFAI